MGEDEDASLHTRERRRHLASHEGQENHPHQDQDSKKASARMNVEHAPTTMAESRERHSYARVPGRWLLLARGIWIVLVILTLGTYFASLSVFISQLHTPCFGPACAYGMRLTPEQGGALTGMGLSLGDYAAFTVALTLATTVVCLVVSTLIIWRRPDDRMAFLVALMLVTLGPII